MKSHALLRTQVGLTTNYKFIVSSNYELYLDSIPSEPDLNIQTLKKFQLTKDSSWEYALSKFWKKFPSTIAYSIKYDDDVDLMFDSFAKQYDSIYHSGARNIVDNKNYQEEYEYFAPLHISKNNLPQYFIIFRVDDSGILKLTKDNFRSEILNKMKCVKVFDLTRKTDLGLFLEKNINLNKNFPTSSLNVKFDDYYSSITGIKYPKSETDGGFAEMSFTMDFKQELPFYDLQKILLDNFNKLGVIYPFIINFSFLFNDLPATPTSLRRWSLNRYLGFYFDKMDQVVKISPTSLPNLKSGVTIIDGNFLNNPDGVSPFTDDTLENLDRLYICVDGNFYKIQVFSEIGEYTRQESQVNPTVFQETYVRQVTKKYKIQSEINLVGKTIENSNLSSISFVYEDGLNKIKKSDGTSLTIPNFEDSDMWLIQINDEYFKLKQEDDFICVNTDYAFSQTETTISYYINDPDPNYKKTFDISLKLTTEPFIMKIFRGQFTDVKDFDTDIVETEFAKFEYEKDSELTITEESKLYFTNTNTELIDDFRFGTDLVYIPTSSEYTANNETFRLSRNNLTDYQLTPLWRKNPTFVKWGYEGSICSNDYPYYLNNSVLADPFNSSTNFVDIVPKRVEKNLDYFYSVNSDGGDYVHHSLHVEKRVGGIVDKNFNFELDKYLGISYSSDYFTYFFGQKNEFQNNTKNIEKWSYFVGGEFETNTTVFKALKLALKAVSGVSPNGEVSTRNTNEFIDYKFSILMNENNYLVNADGGDVNKGVPLKVNNYLKWDIIEPWKINKTYATGSLVIWEESVYKANFKNRPTVGQLPNNQKFIGADVWSIFTDYDTIYWYPTINNNFIEYSDFRSVVYRDGDYYFMNPYPFDAEVDFWHPTQVYTQGSGVIYKKYVWSCATFSSLGVKPPETLDQYYSYTDSEKSISHWVPSEFPKMVFYQDGFMTYANLRWFLVLEKPNFYTSIIRNGTNTFPSDLEDKFSQFKVVSYNSTVYGTTQSTNLYSPETDPQWIRLHSFEQTTDIVYGPSASQNNVVKMNSRNYLCLSNRPDVSNPDGIINQTLDNGVIVYINKKFKNVLVNIYINDNTMKRARTDNVTWTFYENKISNCNRDKLYNDVYSKLTANNFLNVLSYKNKNLGFSDKLRYVIINEDGSFNIYDFNDPNSFKNIPVILEPVFTTPTSVNKEYFSKSSVDVSDNILKANRYLSDGLITTKSTLNYYSDVPLANLIQYMEGPKENIPLFRLNGSYSPIFKTIQLFRSNTIDKNYDNYKFDTELTEFGLTGEHVISKINRNGSILKLKDRDNPRSIYPMLDEFGYHVVKRNIFKSNWDLEYHFECVLPEIDEVNNDEKTLTINKNETDSE
jgi:hypothetical protein